MRGGVSCRPSWLDAERARGEARMDGFRMGGHQIERGGYQNVSAFWHGYVIFFSLFFGDDRMDMVGQFAILFGLSPSRSTQWIWSGSLPFSGLSPSRSTQMDMVGQFAILGAQPFEIDPMDLDFWYLCRIFLFANPVPFQAIVI